MAPTALIFSTYTHRVSVEDSFSVQKIDFFKIIFYPFWTKNENLEGHYVARNSSAFPKNFSVNELIHCSHSNSPLFYYRTQTSSVCVCFTLKRCKSPPELSHLPAEQLSLNGSRCLLRPSFTPAATTSAGIKSYKPETNTNEI